MKQLLISLRVLAVFTLITGLLYPLLVTLFAQAVFAEKARGQLVFQNSNLVGSALLAQKFDSPGFFWPRPSSTDYVGSGAGGTNLSPTSLSLQKQVLERMKQLGESDPGQEIPAELLFASGSGLDPHLSPEAALFQAARVAAARNLDVSTVRHLVESLTEKRQWGILGRSRVNVLALNRALEEMSP